ncbi:MFS transporter [Marmoricola endophyticus]|uniref:MFS transporter n=1 Tax=Marmoricola endophyticus TaxID=2040280 RepID=A0A917F190_9ACTN|nr:MFS transporter [Marmoricola endophyticus]GGF32712.1 MFS transporter [Marmoricola endophyticus]
MANPPSPGTGPTVRSRPLTAARAGLGAYRRVLSRPGALAFSGSGVIGRMPLSMMTLAIVLLITSRDGSYTLAGQVSAAFVVANAALAVPQGRLLDRFGQRPVLLVAGVLFALGTGLVVGAVLDDWSAPWPHAAAALAGATQPQVGGSVRARWAHVLAADVPAKQTAFALEAVLDEVVFMVGPTVATFLATLVAPVAGLVAAVVLGTSGTVALALQDRTAPPPRRRVPDTPRTRSGPMPWGALLVLTASGVAAGSMFGSVEVATVAFAREAGAPAASGVLLAAWALGSLVSGVVVGAVTWRASSVVRLRAGATFLALAMAPTPFLPGLVPMGVVLLVAGVAISPTLVAAITRVEETVPPTRLTEGMGLMQAGLGAGIAPGAALAGLVVDRAGGSAAYGVGVASAVLAVVAAAAARDGGPRSSPDEFTPVT